MLNVLPRVFVSTTMVFDSNTKRFKSQFSFLWTFQVCLEGLTSKCRFVCLSLCTFPKKMVGQSLPSYITTLYFLRVCNMSLLWLASSVCVQIFLLVKVLAFWHQVLTFCHQVNKALRRKLWTLCRRNCTINKSPNLPAILICCVEAMSNILLWIS